jgi:2-polyprenyl-3-methyl-5-hydroxy-6-metoxy-1,4-benzoquinol methylase
MPVGGGARYDEIADVYVGAVGDDVSDEVASSLLALVGDVRGQRVLDLACGQGRISRALARRAASVVGADVSTALLAKAEAAESDTPLGITYTHVDVTAPDALAGERFDGVACHFGLSDIDDLGASLATVSRVLRPGGWFVFSIVHPCFPGWGPDTPSSWQPGKGYYAEGWWLAGSPGFRGKVGASHRTLSTYLNGLVEHGLALERVEEPEPTTEWLLRQPGRDAVPLYLVARCERI